MVGSRGGRRKAVLAPQPKAALAPTAQATAPVPVSSKPELGKPISVILRLSRWPPGPVLPLRGQARSLAAQPVGGWGGEIFLSRLNGAKACLHLLNSCPEGPAWLCRTELNIGPTPNPQCSPSSLTPLT